MSPLPHIVKFKAPGNNPDDLELEWTEGGLLYRMRATISSDGVTVTRQQVHTDGSLELSFEELSTLDALCRHWVEVRDSWAAVHWREFAGDTMYLRYRPGTDAKPTVISTSEESCTEIFGRSVERKIPRPRNIGHGIVQTAEIWRTPDDGHGELIGEAYEFADGLSARAERFHMIVRPREPGPLLKTLWIDRCQEDFIAALCRMKRP